jgi:tight adherence protein B
MTPPIWAGVLLAAAVLVWPRSTDRPVRPADLLRGSDRPVKEPSAASHRWRGHGWRRSAPVRPDAELVPLLEGLAATLRAGLTPARALQHLATTHASQVTLVRGVNSRAQGRHDIEDLVSRLAANAAQGAPLEPVWRREAQVRGSPALLAVAEGWGLTERHGAPLVDVLDVTVGALRDSARTDAAVEAALAAPRATARLLGALPLGGLVLGELVGVHPLSVLAGTAAGRVVGAAGLGCTFAGRVWMRRLVADVTEGTGR